MLIGIGFVSSRITQQSHQAYALIFIRPPTTQLNTVNWLISGSKVIMYCIFVYFISSHQLAYSPIQCKDLAIYWPRHFIDYY